MNKLLHNKSFSVEIKKEGAEVVSFKKIAANCEYIWNGDKNFWAGHSPVLFPIVCALKNGETTLDGIVYKMGNHGFARKSDFELIEESDLKAVYKLSFSEDTLAIYPFQFNLYIIYTLNDNKLSVEFKIENIDNKTMYFQIGTHPGFNCPLDSKTNFEDYYIEFDCAEKLERLYLNSANVIINDKSKTLELKNNNALPLNHEMFNDGAIVLKNLRSKKVTLKSHKTDKNIVLTYNNFPHMGIWQAKDASFICIEPWHGLADTDDFKGEFKDKELIVSLEKETTYGCSYMIEIN
jgi:galactose mutarotase-like enzyme